MDVIVVIASSPVSLSTDLAGDVLVELNVAATAAQVEQGRQPYESLVNTFDNVLTPGHDFVRDVMALADLERAHSPLVHMADAIKNISASLAQLAATTVTSVTRAANPKSQGVRNHPEPDLT